MLKRVVTAGVLIPLVVAGVLLLPAWSLDLILAGVILSAAWEFVKISGWTSRKGGLFLGFLGLLPLTLAVSEKLGGVGVGLELPFVGVGWLVLTLLTLGVGWWLVMPYWLWRYQSWGEEVRCNRWLVGTMVFLPSWLGLAITYHYARILLIYLLVIVWAADIGAYFVGKLWGRHPLASQLSPKKSWEGVGGGIVAAIAATLIWSKFFATYLSGAGMIGLGGLALLVSVWSVVGDLLESMLKRIAKVKDSGRWLPGHGGIYDRIDSLTATAPIFAWGIFLINLCC